MLFFVDGKTLKIDLYLLLLRLLFSVFTEVMHVFILSNVIIVTYFTNKFYPARQKIHVPLLLHNNGIV